MKDVFISYNTKDKAWARQICDTLSMNGISYWIAPECIPGGSNYTTEIPNAIKGCTAFLVLLTPDSQKSPWVRKELDTAITNQKLIIPLIGDTFELKDDFAFLLNGVQHYSLAERKDPTSEILDRIKEEKQKQNNTEPSGADISGHACPKCGCANITQDYMGDSESLERKMNELKKKLWMLLLPCHTSMAIAITLLIQKGSIAEIKYAVLIPGIVISVLVTVIELVKLFLPAYVKMVYLRKNILIKKVSCCKCGYRFKIKLPADNYLIDDIL